MSKLWVPSSARDALEEVRVLYGDEAREYIDRKKYPPIAGGAIPGPGFVLNSIGFAPGAGNAKTAIAWASGANNPVHLAEFSVSADATSGFLLVELTYSTGATAGTAGSTSGAQQIRGTPQTLNATYGTSYTAEPGTQTRIKAWRFPMPGGPFVLQSPLGREPNTITAASTAGKQMCIRVTPSVAANIDTYAEIEE